MEAAQGTPQVRKTTPMDKFQWQQIPITRCNWTCDVNGPRSPPSCAWAFMRRRWLRAHFVALKRTAYLYRVTNMSSTCRPLWPPELPMEVYQILEASFGTSRSSLFST